MHTKKCWATVTSPGSLSMVHQPAIKTRTIQKWGKGIDSDNQFKEETTSHHAPWSLRCVSINWWKNRVWVLVRVFAPFWSFATRRDATQIHTCSRIACGVWKVVAVAVSCPDLQNVRWVFQGMFVGIWNFMQVAIFKASNHTNKKNSWLCGLFLWRR